MLKYTFNLLFVFNVIIVVGQSPLPDTELPEAKDYRPTQLKLSYDVIPLGKDVFTNVHTGHHFQASIDFYNYFFVAEYGLENTTRGSDTTYHYSNEGWYWRVGPEVNFLKNDKQGNSLTFGLRFARSYFNDQVQFASTESPFGNLTVTDGNPDVVATWAELTAGLNVNVWKGLYMGYTIRYKFLRNVKGVGDFAPYDIPGWGQYRNESAAGFSYFIGWVFSWRDKFSEVEKETNSAK